VPNRARPAAWAAAAGAGIVAYSSLLERNAFVLRRFEVPVLAPGATPLRVLHLSDLHLLPRQRRKQDWTRGLAALHPDLVINTGDTWSSADAIPSVVYAFEPLLDIPGAFVPGNNDYYLPRPKNPARYFMPQRSLVQGPELPWAELSQAMAKGSWLDITHRRESLTVGSAQVAVAGTDDPHLERARYEYIQGPADESAAVRIGVTHSPDPELVDRFAADGYDLVLAGHTHGGQVRVPFGPAIVTNCGLDVWRARGLHQWNDRTWLHVSAGLGTSPWQPVRFGCRPEASLLTLVPRGEPAGNPRSRTG
jgi:predicted MPP superfamily phosphohydrolase